jgi:hypothetical protein
MMTGDPMSPVFCAIFSLYFSRNGASEPPSAPLFDWAKLIVFQARNVQKGIMRQIVYGSVHSS